MEGALVPLETSRRIRTGEKWSDLNASDMSVSF